MRVIRSQTALAAFGFTICVPAVGYLCFGIWPSVLFLIGYLSGFVMWLYLPTCATFKAIRPIYIIAFLLFIAHRAEEKIFGFFTELAAITKQPIPEVISWPVITLVLLSVGGWIGGAYLYARGKAFGHYLLWTFFASLGITELAHFILPLYREAPYGYFPGMATVFLLAPVAWLGMYKLTCNPEK